MPDGSLDGLSEIGVLLRWVGVTEISTHFFGVGHANLSVSPGIKTDALHEMLGEIFKNVYHHLSNIEQMRGYCDDQPCSAYQEYGNGEYGHCHPGTEH